MDSSLRNATHRIRDRDQLFEPGAESERLSLFGAVYEQIRTECLTSS